MVSPIGRTTPKTGGHRRRAGCYSHHLACGVMASSSHAMVRLIASADLKFLQQLRQTPLGTSNRSALIPPNQRFVSGGDHV